MKKLFIFLLLLQTFIFAINISDYDLTDIEDRNNLLTTVTLLPKARKNIPNIQKAIINQTYPYKKDELHKLNPRKYITQSKASLCTPYPEIQNLLADLGKMNGDDALQVIIQAPHIRNTHTFHIERKEKKDHLLIRNIKNNVALDVTTNKTIFPHTLSLNDIIRVIYDSIPKNQFEEESEAKGEKEEVEKEYKNLIAIRKNSDDKKSTQQLYYDSIDPNLVYEVVVTPDEKIVRTAYPIFIYHEFKDGDLEINIEGKGTIYDGAIEKAIKPFNGSINHENLKELIKKTSHKDKMYEFIKNDKNYIILDISGSLRNKFPESYWPQGIYLLIEKNQKDFPIDSFGNLYSPEEKEAITKATREQISRELTIIELRKAIKEQIAIQKNLLAAANELIKAKTTADDAETTFNERLTRLSPKEQRRMRKAKNTDHVKTLNKTAEQIRKIKKELIESIQKMQPLLNTIAPETELSDQLSQLKNIKIPSADQLTEEKTQEIFDQTQNTVNEISEIIELIPIKR